MSNDKRKVIDEISDEDLLRIVQDSDEQIDVGKLTDAAKFIYHFNIKAGDEKVLASLIYFTYKEWIGKDKAQPKWLFFRDFTKYFERKNQKSQIFYYLNPKPFDMSQETYWQIRREIRDKREKNRQKKARQSKISSTDEKV